MYAILLGEDTIIYLTYLLLLFSIFLLLKLELHIEFFKRLFKASIKLLK